MKLLVLGHGLSDHPLLEGAVDRDDLDLWPHLASVFGLEVIDRMNASERSWCVLVEVDDHRGRDRVPELLAAKGVLGVASSEILAEYLSHLYAEALRWRQHARDWQAGVVVTVWMEKQATDLGGVIARLSQHVPSPIRFAASVERVRSVMVMNP